VRGCLLWKETCGLIPARSTSLPTRLGGGRPHRCLTSPKKNPCAARPPSPPPRLIIPILTAPTAAHAVAVRGSPSCRPAAPVFRLLRGESPFLAMVIASAANVDASIMPSRVLPYAERAYVPLTEMYLDKIVFVEEPLRLKGRPIDCSQEYMAQGAEIEIRHGNTGPRVSGIEGEIIGGESRKQRGNHNSVMRAMWYVRVVGRPHERCEIDIIHKVLTPHTSATITRCLPRTGCCQYLSLPRATLTTRISSSLLGMRPVARAPPSGPSTCQDEEDTEVRKWARQRYRAPQPATAEYEL